MSRLRLITALAVAFALSTGSHAATAADEPKDELVFVSVVPGGSVQAGVETTFTFEIDVTLESADEAWLNLGFNSTDSPTRFSMVSQFLLRRGMEWVKISGKAVPKDWGRSGQFAATLNIGPKELKAYSPKAVLHHVISVVP